MRVLIALYLLIRAFRPLTTDSLQALLVHNAKVYLAARSETKAREAIADLRASTGGKEALFLKMDLADLRSVRTAAEEFLRFVHCCLGIPY